MSLVFCWTFTNCSTDPCSSVVDPDLLFWLLPSPPGDRIRTRYLVHRSRFWFPWIWNRYLVPGIRIFLFAWIRIRSLIYVIFFQCFQSRIIRIHSRTSDIRTSRQTHHLTDEHVYDMHQNYLK